MAELGCTALPMLLRKLSHADESVSTWAGTLIELIASAPSARDRVVRDLRDLANQPNAAPALRARASAVLAELGAVEPPQPTNEVDALALRDRSLRELASCLDSAAEIARAADLLVHQLEEDELLGFLDEFATGEPRRAAALLDEILVRDDVDERTRSELRRLRAPLRQTERQTTHVRRRARPLVRIARHDDGRELVLCVLRRPQVRPVRYRVLWCVSDGSGVMLDADYKAEVTGGAIERDMLEPLRGDGFDIRRVPSRAGASKLVSWARTAIERGYELPREYYLGCDVVGLFDEHWPQDGDISDDLTVMLARAIDLLAIAEYQRARPLLERYVAARPDDAEGCSNLGVCLLAVDDPLAAAEQLTRAAWLEPANALHSWNLAAAAHRAGNRGRCYLALLDYNARTDARANADVRGESAEEFVAEYERLVRVEYGDVAPTIVAHAEDLCARAQLELEAGRTEEAIVTYENAVALVPDHFSAWRDLGSAYLRHRDMAEAQRCFERALALHPGDVVTGDCLAALPVLRAER